MKAPLFSLVNELLTMIFLVVFFTLLATVLVGGINEISPPAEGELTNVSVTASKKGMAGVILAFVSTMYLYRFSLSVSRKSKQKNTST